VVDLLCFFLVPHSYAKSLQLSHYSFLSPYVCLAYGQYIFALGLSGNLTIFFSHKPNPDVMMTAWPHAKVLLLVILVWLLI
jgi:hypothetical protein